MVVSRGMVGSCGPSPRLLLGALVDAGWSGQDAASCISGWWYFRA
jgi:hypothetical protein